MKASSLYYLLLATGLALPTTTLAQNELSNFTATGRGGVINTFAQDYQAIGINPANLGRAGQSAFAFTIGEVGAGAASQSLSKSLVNKIISEQSTALSAADRVALLSSFADKNALNLNVDATALAFSVSLPAGLGGLAVSTRQRFNSHLAMNQNAADIVINGRNAAIVKQYYDPTTGAYLAGSTPPPLLSDVLDGTALQMALTNEFNISNGNQVLNLVAFKLSAGVGYRYIQGIGIADVRVSGGEFYGYSALAPVFNVNYGAIVRNPNFNYRDGARFQTVGSGNGFDVGLAAEVGKALRLGASVTDLGQMSWDGNVLTATDQPLRRIESQGLQTYDVIQEVANLFDNKDGTLFKYEANKERKQALPAKLRLGAGFRLSELFEVGLDVTAPLNKVAGNLPSTFVGAGLDFKPVHWLRLSTGVSGGAGYKAALPLGITFATEHYEAGISSRDVTGYFREKSPYYSVALGFLRFKFGAKS